jgi:hypothetical protein
VKRAATILRVDLPHNYHNKYHLHIFNVRVKEFPFITDNFKAASTSSAAETISFKKRSVEFIAIIC